MSRKIIGVTVGTPVNTDTTLTQSGKPADAKAVGDALKNVQSVGVVVDEETLTMVGGVLSVKTTDQMEKDNTQPITSSAVYGVVGNIEVLLKTI